MSRYKLGDVTNASYTNDWSRVPRDPVTMWVAGQVVAGAAAVGITITGVAYAAVVALSFVAVTAVTTAVVSALMPKPNFANSSRAGSSGLLVNQRDGLASAQFVYGTVRKGGPVTYLKSTGSNNKILHQIIVLASHEVEAIDQIYINDEVVDMEYERVTSEPWNGHIKIYKHLGNQTATNKLFANSAPYPDPETDEDDTTNFLGLEILRNHPYYSIWNRATWLSRNEPSNTPVPTSLENTLYEEVDDIPPNFVGEGLAYLYVRYAYNQDAFVNGLPSISAVVKGKRVVSTVNGVEQPEAFSNNPAWVIRDFLTSEYGLGADDSEIDYASFESAAEVCDETDFLEGWKTQTTKYATDGVISSTQSHGEILNDLVTTCGGTLFWGAGKWRLYAGDWVEPTRTLTESDLRGPINIATKTPMRDQFNVVGGTFIQGGVSGPPPRPIDGFNISIMAPDHGDWISADYPEINADNLWVSQDTVEKKLDLPLPFTTNVGRAQLLAKQVLYRSREQITFSAMFGIECMDIEVGDFVNLTIGRYGWNQKAFEVVGWSLELNDDGAVCVMLTLKETSEAAYSFSSDEVQDIDANNTELVKFYDVPPLGLTVGQDYRVINQNVTNVLTVDVTSTDPDRIDYVILKYKKSTDTNYKTVGQGKLVGGSGTGVANFEINDIETPQIGENAIVYDVHVTPVNSFGFRGTPTETTFNVSADTVPPEAPTNLTKVLSGGTAFFNWEGSTSLDLSHYKLYYNTDTNATFGDVGNEVKIAKIARPATSISYPVGVGKYFVSAVDKTGNESQLNVPSVLVAANELPALDADQEFDEHTSFSGSKTNLTVSNGSLFLTNSANTGSVGTYNFDHNGLSYFDLGSSRTARLSYVSAHTRKHANAVNGEVNWDDIPDNWDSWPNFWDTWTDEEAAFQDHQVIVEGRAGSTVAAMNSAAWTTVPCELVGRYVEFRARLTNSGPNVSPSVTALTAKVEY